MEEKIQEYENSLSGRKENTRMIYISRLRKFAKYLKEQGIERFEDATAKDVDAIFANHLNQSTK